jgi:hypothetical protein
MGCDYYIYTALKIVHTDGIEHIILNTEPVYLYGESDDDVCIHPLNRKPKIDYMKVDLPDVLVYKKGEPNEEAYIEEYMTMIKEQINCNLDITYKTTNKYVKEMDRWGFHLDKGNPLKSINDINEIYIIEARRWRN